MAKRPFVFLDRDGTIIEEKHYLSDPAQVVLLDGAGRALKELQNAGFGLAVVSNQSGIGRGYFTAQDLKRVNGRLAELLESCGVQIEGWYFCPHGPGEHCGCRKPETGMLTQAALQLDVDFSRSFVVGDKICDLELGRRMGMPSFLVRTGHGKQEEKKLIARGENAAVAEDLREVSTRIINLVKGNVSHSGEKKRL